MPIDPAEIARRVAGRVLAERGLARHPGGHGELPGGRARGVHVDVDPGGARRRPEQEERGGGAEAPLLTVESLSGVPDGGRLALAPGARVTPLALEEAWRRGIALGDAGGAAAGRRLRVAVGGDHGGFEAKQRVLGWLAELGHQALDLGTHDENAVDYPDFAEAVARAVAAGRADLGVCVDGAGIGSAMAANKVVGVRAATCWDEASARNAREHNFANVLSLGGRNTGAPQLERILRAFLSTPEGAARHERRVEKIAAIERRETGRPHPVRRVLPDVEAR